MPQRNRPRMRAQCAFSREIAMCWSCCKRLCRKRGKRSSGEWQLAGGNSIREGRGGREGRCAERVCRVASRDSGEKCGGGAADERILRGAQWWWVERSARENCLIWGADQLFLHSHSVSSCAHKFAIRWLGAANAGRLSLIISRKLHLQGSEYTGFVHIQ